MIYFKKSIWHCRHSHATSCIFFQIQQLNPQHPMHHRRFSCFYMYVHKLFGACIIFLTSLQGTQKLQSMPQGLPVQVLFPRVRFHQKRERDNANYQKVSTVYNQKDKVLLPWTLKEEVYQQYCTTGADIVPECDQDSFGPCSRVYFLLLGKKDCT